MDLRQALLTALYNRLTGDATLQALCGGTVRLIYRMAQPDTQFPYLTQRVTIEPGTDGSWAFATGTWFLDIWDHQPNASRALSIRQRVITLMDWYFVHPVDGEVDTARVDLVRDEDGPTDDPNIFRLMLQWSLHLDRQGEVVAILGR